MDKNNYIKKSFMPFPILKSKDWSHVFINWKLMLRFVKITNWPQFLKTKIDPKIFKNYKLTPSFSKIKNRPLFSLTLQLTSKSAIHLFMMPVLFLLSHFSSFSLFLYLYLFYKNKILNWQCKMGYLQVLEKHWANRFYGLFFRFGRWRSFSFPFWILRKDLHWRRQSQGSGSYPSELGLGQPPSP